MDDMGKIRVARDGAIITVILSNPGKLNAIDVSMWRALKDAFLHIAADDSIRCVIVRGDDGNFAAGADIEEFPTVRSTIAQGMRYHTETIAQALNAIAECPHPTLAAIDGVCVGGGLEIACCCDIRIASPSARFGIPINRLGFPLAPDELQLLLQLVGRATAMEILLEGRIFDAVEAKDKRLIHRIETNIEAGALSAAQRIAKGAPSAARTNKQLVKRFTPPVAPLTEQELRAAFAFLETADYAEGIRSFLEKRPPHFSGK